MQKLSDLSKTELSGKYVLLRGSLNVPLRDGQVFDDYRLQQLFPTISFLKDAGAKIILIGHIGRELTDTLRPVYEYLENKLPISWGGRVDSKEFAEARAELRDGEVLLAENIRQDVREVENHIGLTELLASLAEVYVNDAFADSHREHASIYGVAKLLPAYAGLAFADEVEELSRALEPESPSLFILGGAKFETKMPLLEKYLDIYDHIFVGGALLNDMLLAEGCEVGKSLVSDVSLQGQEWLNNPKLIKVIDVVVRSEAGQRICAVSEVRSEEMIIDIGPETVAALAPIITEAKTVLWNGPLGLYESGAEGSTHAVAKLLASSTAFSVIGGGDTVAAIADLGVADKLGFVSTAGGAMLTFLEKGTLPGLEVL